MFFNLTFKKMQIKNYIEDFYCLVSKKKDLLLYICIHSYILLSR